MKLSGAKVWMLEPNCTDAIQLIDAKIGKILKKNMRWRHR